MTLWKELDDSIFALPCGEKRVAWLAQNRKDVIEKLKKDFAKPRFPHKADGVVADGIEDMTYEEVARRMVDLMYVKHQARWVDLSLRNLVGDWLRRVEERFAGLNRAPKASVLQSYATLEDPEPFLDAFVKAYPQAREQLVAAGDVRFFLAIAQRPGQKPVPFIPVLNAAFEVWFKKVRCVSLFWAGL